MKLQELLDKHKDKLWDWCDAILYEEWQIYVNYWRETVDPQTALWQFSLSDLLFSTPFLSLLEWRPDYDSVYKIPREEWTWEHTMYEVEYAYEFHKVKLALLNTDAERIKYIEEFTL